MLSLAYLKFRFQINHLSFQEIIHYITLKLFYLSLLYIYMVYIHLCIVHSYCISILKHNS